MAIECKNVREYFPVLVSCTPRHEQESYHQVALLREPEKRSYASGGHMFPSRAKILSVLGDDSLYKPGEPVGKSIAQVGRHVQDSKISASNSELYEKWGQCISSADDLVRDVYSDGEDDKEMYLSAVIPFVVVPNDRLWTATYDNDGKLIDGPETTDRCSCFIGKGYEMRKLEGAYMKLSHVEVVTFDGMRNFVEECLNDKESMAEIFPAILFDALLNLQSP